MCPFAAPKFVRDDFGQRWNRVEERRVRTGNRKDRAESSYHKQAHLISTSWRDPILLRTYLARGISVREKDTVLPLPSWSRAVRSRPVVLRMGGDSRTALPAAL